MSEIVSQKFFYNEKTIDKVVRKTQSEKWHIKHDKLLSRVPISLAFSSCGVFFFFILSFACTN